MKGILVAVFALAFSLGSFGQTKPVAACDPDSAAGSNLNSALDELMRVSPATDRDLSNVHFQGKTHWVTFWRREGAHKEEIAAAVRRNLEFAVPGLVRDTQNSRGSLTATFKLYNDLSVVSESLDSLIGSGSRTSRAEYASLSHDLSDMNRIRAALSSHIQQAAALLESQNPQLVSSVGRPKKIIIDDDISDKPSARKHSAQR